MPTDIENGSQNRRWVICFTNCIESQEKTTVSLDMVAEAYLKNQINIVLICYDLTKEDIKLAQGFIKQMRTATTDDGIAMCEAHLLLDPDPSEVERLFEKRLANYKNQINSPLIIETFT